MSSGGMGGGPARSAAQALHETSPQMATQAATQAPLIRLAQFEDVVALAARQRDIQLKLALERNVHLIRFEEGSIEFSLGAGASPQLAQNLMRRLQEWTGTRWMVAISKAQGAPSLREQAAAKAKEAQTGVEMDPLVQSVLAAFPGAQIVSVKSAEEPPPPVSDAVESNDEIAYADQIYTEDDL
jgi:DNA polymerase-3 subunit gamma/tau